MSSAAVTPNLGLPQWVAGEKPERTDFNAAFLAIDDIGVMAGWISTLTGITIGNGTVVSRYSQIGNIVYFEFRLLLGSTTSVTGSVSFTLPSTAKTSHTILGAVIDAGSTHSLLIGFIDGASNYCSVRVSGAAGTYATVGTQLSSTVPMTWAAGDEIRISGTYEAE